MTVDTSVVSGFGPSGVSTGNGCGTVSRTPVRESSKGRRVRVCVTGSRGSEGRKTTVEDRIGERGGVRWCASRRGFYVWTNEPQGRIFWYGPRGGHLVQAGGTYRGLVRHGRRRSPE